jgi:2-methylcitrate dehydratase
MTTSHVTPGADDLPATEQLAWKLAVLANETTSVEEAVADTVADRLIDTVGVALAALHEPPVAVAYAQALDHRRGSGAALIGLPAETQVDCEWAAWANETAVRELDFHDNFYGANVCHPADAIAPIVAVAQQCSCDGAALMRGIVAAYEVGIALAEGINLTKHGLDHVAHLGPAVAAGLGTLLKLQPETIFEAINHAAFVSVSTQQSRRGAITSWKANAPAHVGKVAVEAIDRAMRGEKSPKPVYEGRFGLIACFFGGRDASFRINLPDAGERRAVLQSLPKEHATGYHAQAVIDLAIAMRDKIPDLEAIERIDIATKDYTHFYVGSGANDPEKMNPMTSRENLDHSIMFSFAAAFLDGGWHHVRTFAPERVRRPELVRLWHKVSTHADDEWTRRFRERTPMEKDHGGRATITLTDGTQITEEIAVPNSHPRGRWPFVRSSYIEKFGVLTDSILDDGERERFLTKAARFASLPAEELVSLYPVASGDFVAAERRGIFGCGGPSDRA